MALLEVTDIQKSYGEIRALDGVSLCIESGELLAILGPNGAGKSTLMEIIVGLLRADGGSVVIDGSRVGTGFLKNVGAVGYAPQETGVYPHLTVRQNLRLFARLYGAKGKDAKRRVNDAAEIMLLTDLLDRRGMALSGGERRRLHAGMALVSRPRLILLDEPTVGVDVETRIHLLGAIQQMCEDGVAVCYSTHYLAEVEELDARVSILVGGHVAAEGRVADLVAERGGTAVEFSFKGEPPAVICERGDQNGSIVRIYSDEPQKTLAELMTVESEAMTTLVSVEIVRPSLEKVFVAVTNEIGHYEVNE